MKTKEIDELINKEFPDEDAEFCGCYEGDLHNKWPEGKKKLINFASTLRQSVLEEVRENMPKKLEEKLCECDLDYGHGGCGCKVRDFNDCLDQVTSLINNLIEEKEYGK